MNDHDAQPPRAAAARRGHGCAFRCRRVQRARNRRARDGKAVTSALAVLRQACADGRNVMPPLVDAVKTYATVGEISDVMREVFATYEEPAVF